MRGHKRSVLRCFTVRSAPFGEGHGYDRRMPSADEILQRMKAIQERREEAIRPLLALLAERSQLLKKLEELKEPYGRAYVMAEEGGWTPEELAALGADEPVKRPRRRKRTAKKPAANAPETGSPAAAVPAQGPAPAQDAPVGTGSSD